MKKNILTILLAAAITFLLVDRFTNTQKPAIPDYYKKEYAKTQQAINALELQSKKNRQIINGLRYEITLFDSLVYSSDERKLDSLFGNFFNSVGR